MYYRNEEIKDQYYGQYKHGLTNSISIFETYILLKGVSVTNGKVSKQTIIHQVDMEGIHNVVYSIVKGKKCLEIDHTYRSLSGPKRDKLYFFNISNIDECYKAIISAVNTQRKNSRQQHQQQQEAKAFYTKCLQFHIKENIPFFNIYIDSNKYKAIVVYINKDKSLNFLKVDGYSKGEDVGVIPYSKIHYYERAGNVHYVSETNVSYSSFGGSLTGATISKGASLFGGLMFGAMGMTTAALMSYKPAQQKPAETHFDLMSETKRIDERNVLLNFYSDDKGQYIDIELPQEIYNFFQTHLPEKKYEIVSEVEKHNAVNKAIDDQKSINAPETKAALPNAEKLSFDEFKEKVDKLKIMKDAGLLSDEEFNAEKTKLLALI